MDNLQWIVVHNLSDTFSFNPYLAGVTGVLHIASPSPIEVLPISVPHRNKANPS
jgi:hypothetical protein